MLPLFLCLQDKRRRRVCPRKASYAQRGGGPPFVDKRCVLPLALPFLAKKLFSGPVLHPVIAL